MVNEPGDSYEREAHQVAEQIGAISNLSLQKTARSAGEWGEEELAHPGFQRVATESGHAADSAVETAIRQARGGGRPLADSVRQPLEQALGASLDQVRVHTDARSDALNQTLQARAFTTGKDIFFRRGEYRPGSSEGRELLTHELTHAVQQTAGTRATQGKTLVQRAIHPTAERALNKAIKAGGGAMYGQVKQKLEEESCPLTLKQQKKIIHLWSWKEKLSQLKKAGKGTEKAQELKDRLDYVRAFLIADAYKMFMNWSKMFPKKQVMKMLWSHIGDIKKDLQALGITKAGKISRELNELLETEHTTYWEGEEYKPIKGPRTEVDLDPRIEVRGAKIPGLEIIPGNWHSYIVYVDENGEEHVISAGAGGKDGKILEADTIDGSGDEWEKDAPARILEKGEATKGKWESLKSAAKALNTQNYPYRFFTQNCNTAASHFLKEAGVENIKAPPGGLYPGWGNKLKHAKKKK